MDWKTTNRKRLMLKISCAVLALIFGVSFFITSGFAKSLCGAECCCPPLAEMGHHAGTQLRGMNSHECCSGVAAMPCGIDSGRSIELSEFVLAASTSNFSNEAGSWSSSGFLFIETDYSHSRVFGHMVLSPHPYSTTSLYLQKQSLLIWFQTREKFSASVPKVRKRFAVICECFLCHFNLLFLNSIREFLCCLRHEKTGWLRNRLYLPIFQ